MALKLRQGLNSARTSITPEIGELIYATDTKTVYVGDGVTAGGNQITSGGSGSGTVTSVGGTGTVSGISLSGTVTASGNLTLGGTLAVTASNFASQTANRVLAAPNGSNGTPTFRALVAADIPTLNQNTTGTAANVTDTVAIANGGTGATTAAGALTSLGAYAASNPSGYTSNLGTVTSASVASANGFAGTVANATTTPAITISTSITGILKGNGTAISAASSGTDYQAPITLTTIGSSGAATLVGTTLNIPQYSTSGGSGTVTSVAATVPGFLSVTGSPITTSGTLAFSYSGTALPIANGGTALTTTPTNGQLLIGNGTGYTLAALTAGSNITITNSPGGISIAGNAGTVTSVAELTLGTTGSDLSSTVANGTSTPVITLNVPTASASNRGVLSAADWTTFNSKGSGTVTSVGQSFTGGLISVAGSPVTSSGTLALTVAGTSGGIPYFSGASTWASSAALASNALMVGGGAGAAPATVTTGTGVVTALGVNTGSSGAFMVQGSAIISSSTVNDSAGTGYTIGYRQMPQNSQTGATYTLALADDGKHIYLNTGSTNTITVPTNASVAFAIGTVITVVNGNSGTCTITGPTSGLQLANGAAATSRSLATKGMATMVKVATDLWYVSGAGVT